MSLAVGSMLAMVRMGSDWVSGIEFLRKYSQLK